MSIGADIFTRLSTDVAVSALAGTRIYAGVFKQQDILPAIRYSKIAAVNHSLMGVDAGVEISTYQIDVISATYAQMDALRDAVKTSLRRWRKAGIQDTYITSDSDMYDDETQLHRARINIDIVEGA